MGQESKIYTAIAVVIGNEILSGRTQDRNIQYIAEKLGAAGIRLTEVRVVPDVREKIIKTINEVRPEFDYVLTTGGIGPTHDDITAESIAAAFGVPLTQNKEAYDILLGHYKKKEELTDARLKMTMIPEGAKLVANPVSGAPGFNIGNVYVMAGVPKIMQGMLDDIVLNLKGGAVILSVTVEAPFPESKIAKGLENIQNTYPDIDIGSYPQYLEGRHLTSLVLRGTDKARLDKARAEVQALTDSLML